MTEPRTTGDTPDLREAVTEFLRRWDDPERYHRIPAVDDLRAALSQPEPLDVDRLAEALRWVGRLWNGDYVNTEANREDAEAIAFEYARLGKDANNGKP